MTTDFEACPVGTLAELERLRAALWGCFAEAGGDTDGRSSPAGISTANLIGMATLTVRDLRDCYRDLTADSNAQIGNLSARVAERDRVHAGVDICEVAAAVEVVRAMDIVKDVAGLVARLHEGPFRHGFETACEEIEHRLRPCERCGDSPKAGA